MKETLAGIIQQRMDKCTVEQFWAVAALTGMQGFVITQKALLLESLPAFVIIFVTVVATLYVLGFVCMRHAIYRIYDAEFARLLADDADAPPFLKPGPVSWKRKVVFLSGVLFYSVWCFATGIATVVVYLK
jgi:hypothetical protein